MILALFLSTKRCVNLNTKGFLVDILARRLVICQIICKRNNKELVFKKILIFFFYPKKRCVLTLVDIYIVSENKFPIRISDHSTKIALCIE
jgi:hypothetical protein